MISKLLIKVGKKIFGFNLRHIIYNFFQWGFKAACFTDENKLFI